MEHINKDLAKRLHQRSLSTTATAAYVCHVANQHANGRYRAVSYRAGLLTIAAPTSGTAQNLRFDQGALLSQLATATKQPELRLRIVVRPVLED